MNFEAVVDTTSFPLGDAGFRGACRRYLRREGALMLPGFLKPAAIEEVRREGEANRHKAYFCIQRHNVYLRPADPALPPSHARNREVVSSKGCITDDLVPRSSPLRILYDAPAFRAFLCDVLEEAALYPYADPLSSINIHYAGPGQELGWHFDNSSFAITLMIQPPAAGGAFEYVGNVRNADAGDMNFERVLQILGGEVEPNALAMDAGALVLFRGRNALHRVTPVEGDRTRMLAVLAYNSQPGIALSEAARITFYGRLQ